MAGLHAAGRVEVEHRQAVVARRLHQDRAVIGEHRADVELPARAVALRVLLTKPVQRRDDDDGLAAVARNQSAHQEVARAAERGRIAVVKRADGRVAVAEVVRAAEDHDRVRALVHLRHAQAEVALVRLAGIHPLARDARAAHAVVVCLRAVHPGEDVGVAVGFIARARALCDAVAQKIDHCMLKLHGILLKQKPDTGICRYPVGFESISRTSQSRRGCARRRPPPSAYPPPSRRPSDGARRPVQGPR